MANFKINLSSSAPTASCVAPLELTAVDMISNVVDTGVDFTGYYNFFHFGTICVKSMVRFKLSSSLMHSPFSP